MAGVFAGGMSCSSRTVEGGFHGTVTDSQSRPVAGAFVSARVAGSNVATSVLTDEQGRFTLGPPRGDSILIAVLAHGDTLASVHGPRPGRLDIGMWNRGDERRKRPSSWWLSRLPEGEEKRKFILDCTGCHQFNETRVLQGDSLRSRDAWTEDVERMLGYAGARSGFPVIAADRDPARTAEWLTTHLSVPKPEGDSRGIARPDPGAAHLEITEYDLPMPKDLPHDLAIDDSGRVIITGMFTHVMHRLDPATGSVTPVEIPVPKANPRAVEIAGDGRWWVLLGGPQKIARYEPDSGTWSSWDIGMYPHSIALAPGGTTVWFNGHFTRDPEEMGRLDPASGSVERIVLPPHPTLAQEGGPVPYEQRIAPDGSIWMSELQGNRMIRFDPATKSTRVFELPETWSGPRRFDVAGDGTLWIPAYSGGALWKLEAGSGVFRKYAIPVEDALPYIARVSPRDDRIWIGTAALDAVLAFDPRSERFSIYPLPTRGVTIRHLAIDRETGEVWLAYGASPALHPARVARLRFNGAG